MVKQRSGEECLSEIHAVTTCRGVVSHEHGFDSEFGSDPGEGNAIGIFCIWNPTGLFKTLWYDFEDMQEAEDHHAPTEAEIKTDPQWHRLITALCRGKREGGARVLGIG